MRRRFQSFALEAREDESVDGVDGPGGVPDGWERGTRGRNQRPVLLPFGPLLDPGLEEADLLGREFEAGIDGRHAEGGFFGGDAMNDLAPGDVAGDGGEAAAGEFGEHGRFRIEPEGDLFRGGVRAVADKAPVREDGADVTVEFDRGGGERRESAKEKSASHDTARVEHGCKPSG